MVVNPASVTVTEGESGSFTVVLSSEPSGEVTVTVINPGSGLELDQTTLTFTRANWNVAQTIRVSAPEDADMEDAAKQLILVATGGGYSGGGGIIVNPGDVVLESLGETIQLKAEIKDQHGSAVAGVALDWSSTDSSVAVVDSTGKVTAVNNGITMISAALATASGTAMVVVDDPGIAPVADREVLELLFKLTGGENWTRRAGWLTEAPLDQWEGVRAENSYVVGLNLYDNNLTGRLPKVLSRLSRLRVLRLGDNRLWGPIPPEFGHLSELRELDLMTNNLHGSIPPELKQLTHLEILELRHIGVHGPLPAWLGELTSLHTLNLSGNRFDSPIPPEIGNLSGLRELGLSHAELWGPIPSEIGGLLNLQYLYISRNHFSGALPPELGLLKRLQKVFASAANLAGTIPYELGSLPELRTLWLDGNKLTGSIPSGLGNLQKMESLILASNRLNGPLPKEFGSMSALNNLILSDNGLEGGFPPEWGGLANLRNLELAGNSGLIGELPREWTRLDLNLLDIEGTGLCVPDDSEITGWMARSGATAGICGGGDLDAYLVQATQSRDGVVPLIAGRRALLRAFVTAADPVGRIPDVQAEFYVSGELIYEMDIPGKPGPVPATVNEVDALKSVNASVPGWVIQPDLEIVINVDPAGEVSQGVDLVRRIPDDGRIRVNVAEVPDLELTVLPWVWANDTKEDILELTRGISPESDVFEDTRMLLPVKDIDLMVHEPIYTSNSIGFEIPAMVHAIRAMEGGTGYYMALTSTPDLRFGVAGVAFRSGWSAWSTFDSGVIAHEIGHNLSLGHAPCGVDGDPRYPHPDGSVGSFGFDLATGPESVVHPSTSDFMSYCDRPWVGQWSLERMLSHRLHRETGAATAGTIGKALLVWGGRDEQGGIFLYPAFWVDAPHVFPPSEGEYALIGRTLNGDSLFTVRFDMTESEDTDGRASFAFALPADLSWLEMAELSLQGPHASAVLNEDTNRPSVIRRDATTGQVRAIHIDTPGAARKDGPEGVLAGVRLVEAHSNGLPDPANWSPMGESRDRAASSQVVFVTISPGATAMIPGDTVQLAATALDALGLPVDGTRFEWRSSDADVAAVEPSGLIRALGMGSARITATAFGISGTTEVHIARNSDSVVITPGAATLAAGKTLQFKAVVLDTQGSTVEGVEFEWSSSDTSVVWVDHRGLAYGWRSGTATLTAHTDTGLAGSAEIVVEGVLEGDRFALTRMFARLRGYQWFQSSNWLTDAPLSQWWGVTTDPSTGRVVQLRLSRNNLRGQLGPELGMLTHLTELELSNNTIRGGLPPTLWRLERLRYLALTDLGLTGPLSPEVGNLGQLERLHLSHNILSGNVPSTLGQLENLHDLRLANNDFEGSFPRELFTLPRLGLLHLHHNRLSGALPAGWAQLQWLQEARLTGNRFTGRIPPSLGGARRLTRLHLGDNRLSGEVPSNLGQLEFLAELHIQGNAELQGAFPVGWAERGQDVVVRAQGTQVCAPPVTGLAGWLESNGLTYLPVCTKKETAFAYLVQTVQSREYPTPLIAGEDALLRVFMSPDQIATLPPVRAHFFVSGQLIHTADIAAGATTVGSEITEGDLSQSANQVIPGDILRPGLEMMIEIDPDGILDPALGLPDRIPTHGRTLIDVRSVPGLDLTAIPFLEIDNPDSSLVERIADFEEDPQLTRLADKLLPIDGISLTSHAPVLISSAEFAWNMLQDTEAIRVIEGGEGYYMGTFTHIRSGVVGQASFIGGRSFVSVAEAGVIAHELGHAMNLKHIPCGVSSDEPDYPWGDGRTGSWGYNFDTGELVSPEATDIMGYCARYWISSFHFQKALAHRLRTEEDMRVRVEPEPVLLVWGGIDAEGVPYLRPAFVVEAPPKLPVSGGDHQLTVVADGNQIVAAYAFDMPEISHADGRSAFAFAIPVEPGTVLERITLEGRGGRATLDRDTYRPAILLRDPISGQVRGLLTESSPALIEEIVHGKTHRFSDFEVTISVGLPEVR